MEFGILGPLEIREGDRALPLAGGKQRALLAVLLLHAGEVVSSDRLIDELWGEAPPGSGATALQVRVSQLRKALGTAGQQIVTQDPGYVLRLERGQLDLHSFEQLLLEAEGVEPALASAKLHEALALWRGPALAEFAYEAFAQAPIARLEELRLAALEKRIEADLALGRHAQLVAELEAVVAEHPLREGFHRQLMLALYRSGRQAEALETYRATRQRLVEEIGIEPGPGLQDLERAILRQDAALELERTEVSMRSILVALLDEDDLDALLTLAEPLSRRPPRELILAQLVSGSELSRATSVLHERREALLARGRAARAAVFRSREPGTDLVWLASEQDVDVLLLTAEQALLEGEVARAVLAGAPCDVAVLVTRDTPARPGPVLVPFAGAEHDWAAVELGAWIAGNEHVPLRLAGPEVEGRDSSRLLARASLAVQRALGAAAEPLLVGPGADGLVRAANDAALVVVGLSDRWRREGLGDVRSALARDARPPVLVVRRGLRPGGLAPAESHTRFTWSLRP